MSHHDEDRDQLIQDHDQAAQEELVNTADQWRRGHAGGEVEESASEVARGAEQAAEQPDYGREGS